MGFLEAILCFVISAVVTGAFLVYFNSSIARPIFSGLKDREFEAAVTSLFLLGIGVSGFNVACNFLNVGFFKPILLSALMTLNAVLTALMSGLAIVGVFFVGRAILTHASVLSGKNLNGAEDGHAGDKPLVEAVTSKNN